ncbi:MAG TPA: methylmalonyl-CoA mutase family protein, partial [Candidatus Dormibacteraeota bacterium]|nr:methylmalonyl-CoA mutase family protein [Candidatus Dormibacteraeota bacterium]
AQELAFTLADGMAYVDACIERGMHVDDFASRLSFFFDAHIDFFEEIAKFRAARRIWARWMRERYGAQQERSWKLRFHTQTAGVSLTAQQPELNIARTAVEALAAVLGGTQSLHTNAMDEVLALPTDRAARIALRTQQLLAYETGVANTIDPLGGSYFIESLTDEMERQAEVYFKRIEEIGGVIPAIESGFFQREIADAAFRYQQELEQKRRIMVGVNDFTVDDEEPIEILRIDPRLESEQDERVREVRRKRDQAKCTNSLNRLRKAAAGTDNLMPYILDAVRAYATEGEIMHSLIEVFGTYTETAVV